ncbi:MAG TPA: 50S ribosomal protein L10 [Acidimicrobiales bacterium]
MDNPRPEKVAVVDEVKQRFEAADAALLTEYRGLDVASISQLRRALHEAGGDYKIYKNTLVRFAARDLGLEIDELLTGPTAIAFVQGDAAAVAKALRDSARTNPALIVKGGLLGTKALSADEVRALAELPSREVLLSQLAGAIAAPMQQFAGLLQALPRNFAYGLKALIDERGGVPDEPITAEDAESEPAPEAESDAAAQAPAAEPDGEAEAEAAQPAAEATTETESNQETETPAADTAADTEES